MTKVISLIFGAFLFLSSLKIDQPIITPIAQGSNVAAYETTFDTMMAVLTHPRCLNCHPAGDRPLQGEDSHTHQFNIQRGPDGHGVAALQCQTCHQKENNDFSGVPGAPHWHLAPKSMAWQGLNRVEIAQSMLNLKNNGGKSLKEIEKHLTEDPLVLWAFTPGIYRNGVPREQPPVSEADFIRAVKAWVAQGAPIPEE